MTVLVLSDILPLGKIPEICLLAFESFLYYQKSFQPVTDVGCGEFLKMPLPSAFARHSCDRSYEFLFLVPIDVLPAYIVLSPGAIHQNKNRILRRQMSSMEVLSADESTRIAAE